MKELEPLMMLAGRWTGKGKGPYGPLHGAREGDRLQFNFHDPKAQKASVYWTEGKGLRFDYVSVETQEGGEVKKVHFEGLWERVE